MAEVRRHELLWNESLAGLRLDRGLALAFPRYSRTRIREWIEAGEVTVDGEYRRPRAKPGAGARVTLVARLEAVVDDRAQPVAFDIVHADASILVVNKPAGLVVHPGAGNPDGTLVNGLLQHAPELSLLPRAGLVHRLDKDTSGLLVVARTTAAHAALVAVLARHGIRREYLALVRGEVIAGERIEAPIGRHRTVRTKMAVRGGGRPAVTHTRVAERLRGFTLLSVRLETGRTHQIRVHLAHRGMPVVGDPVYGGRLRLPAGAGPRARAALAGFRRQALHARRLSFAHPQSGEALAFEAPLPQDFVRLLELLRKERP